MFIDNIRCWQATHHTLWDDITDNPNVGAVLHNKYFNSKTPTAVCFNEAKILDLNEATKSLQWGMLKAFLSLKRCWLSSKLRALTYSH